MKVGDCVKVKYETSDGFGPIFYDWTGVCTWTDGYKFEFLISGTLETWTKNDLETVGAEVISESR